MAHYSIEAETSALGSMILSQRAAEELSGVLDPNDFFRPAHKVIFMALRGLVRDSVEIDLVTLRDRLLQLDSNERDGQSGLDMCGGMEYLMQIAEYVPSAANARHYATIVKEKSNLNSFENLVGEIKARIEGPDPVNVQLEFALDEILGLASAQTPPDSSVIDIRQVVTQFMQQIDDRRDLGEFSDWNNPNMVPSMFGAIQDLTRGFERGCLYTIGAPPSMGKTAYLVQELIGFATAGHPVLFVTREMSAIRVIRRFISKLAKVSLKRIRDDCLNDQEYEAVSAAAAQLYSLPIRFFANPQAEIRDVKREAILMSRIYKKVPIVADDYIQLAVDDVSTQEITRFMRAYRTLTNELNTVIILLSQLTRGFDGSRAPQMTDLNGSSSIEANSDVVILINRPEYWEARKEGERFEKDRSTANFHVVKNRDFPIGRAQLEFRPGFTEFASNK